MPDERVELVGEDDDLGQGAASTLLGLAYWTRGDLEAATDLYLGAFARFEKVGYRSDAVGLALALADMRLAQGRLHDAMGTYERGLGIATRGPIVARGAADMHVGISGSSASAMTSSAPRSICNRPGSWAMRTASRRTPTGRAWLLLESGGLRAMSAGRLSFLARLIASTSVISPRTCAQSMQSGRACG